MTNHIEKVAIALNIPASEASAKELMLQRKLEEFEIAMKQRYDELGLNPDRATSSMPLPKMSHHYWEDLMAFLRQMGGAISEGLAFFCSARRVIGDDAEVERSFIYPLWQRLLSASTICYALSDSVSIAFAGNIEQYVY